jgi:hypothetical protein
MSPRQMHNASITSTATLLTALDEKSPALPSAQLELLNSFFAESSGEQEAGIYTSTICEYKDLNAGTKALYLQRALTEDCATFLSSLDRLYRPKLTGQAAMDNLELLRALKLMNDFYHNNEVLFGVYGTRETLKHYLGSLGSPNLGSVQAYMRDVASKVMLLLKKQSPTLESEIANRKKEEIDITPYTDWRKKLDLPKDQLQPQKSPQILLNELILHAQMMMTHLKNLKKEIEERDWDLGPLRKKCVIIVKGKNKNIPANIEGIYQTLSELDSPNFIGDMLSILKMVAFIDKSFMKQFRLYQNAFFSLATNSQTDAFIKAHEERILYLNRAHHKPATQIFQENSHLFRVTFGEDWQHVFLIPKIAEQLNAGNLQVSVEHKAEHKDASSELRPKS